MRTKTISLYIGWPVLRRPQLDGFQAPRDTYNPLSMLFSHMCSSSNSYKNVFKGG
jgi:hypothetical protein